MQFRLALRITVSWVVTCNVADCNQHFRGRLKFENGGMDIEGGKMTPINWI
jgi:hypothetical protein